MYGGGDYSDYYDYLADGTKIQHEYSDGQQDRYIGSLVYYNTGEVSVPFGGGRLVSAGNMTAAHYFLTDHLGSTRVVAKVTPTGRIDLDRKDYYPFGKEWKQSGMPTSSNAFLFSGKERQHSEGYDGAITSFYDFGARFYDPDGVTFIQQDPLLEKYYPIGQYNYCAGNPIKFADHDGRKIVDAKGRVLYQNGQWTEAASGTDAYRVGSAMMATSTGSNTWNKMAESTDEISITISQEITYNEGGDGTRRLVLGKATPTQNGTDITIYEGSLDHMVDSQTQMENTKKQESYRNMDREERIGAVGTHEGTHSIDPTPKTQKTKNVREANAQAAEKKHINETINKKPIIDEDIKLQN